MAFDAEQIAAPTALGRRDLDPAEKLLAVRRKYGPDESAEVQIDSADSLRSSFVVGRPVLRNYAPVTKLHSRLVPLQTWEGFVESIDWDNGTFWARLNDLEPEANGDAEIAEFLISDVDPDARELIREGGVFRWIIGYREEGFGGRERISAIVFRRLPAWTSQDLAAAKSEGRRLSDALQWR